MSCSVHGASVRRRLCSACSGHGTMELPAPSFSSGERPGASSRARTGQCRSISSLNKHTIPPSMPWELGAKADAGWLDPTFRQGSQVSCHFSGIANATYTLERLAECHQLHGQDCCPWLLGHQGPGWCRPLDGTRHHWPKKDRSQDSGQNIVLFLCPRRYSKARIQGVSCLARRDCKLPKQMHPGLTKSGVPLHTLFLALAPRKAAAAWLFGI